MNTVLLGETRHYISSAEMLSHICHTVDNMKGLGFSGKDVSTHSIRSSLATALYLARRPVSTIILFGRWCSDVFLLYIRRQVQEFSTGVSADTIPHESFFTIPVMEEADRLDQRSRNNQSFANTPPLNNPNASTAHCQRPAMHVWH